MQSGVGRTASPEGGSRTEHPTFATHNEDTKARPLFALYIIRRLRLETKELLARRVKETASWGSHTCKPNYRDRATAQRLKRAEDEHGENPRCACQGPSVTHTLSTYPQTPTS